MKFRQRILRKPLVVMNDSEEGIVTKIRGSAGVHRSLLGMGITIGARIRRLANSIDQLPDETLNLLIGSENVRLTEELAGNIQVAIQRVYEEKSVENPMDRHGISALVYSR